MKSLMIWLLSLSLLTSGMILPTQVAYAEPEVDESTIFEIPPAEGDRAVEEMMAVVIPLCKDDRGNWKDEVIKLPLNDEDFNCSSLRKMEFDMLLEQGNPQSEKRAFQCATQDLDAQGKLEFARTLQDMEALQLPLEEHFQCPGKDQDMTDCLKDLTCNAINMVLDQATFGVASWIAEQLSEQKGICPTTTQTNCFNELLYGVVKNVVTNIEGLLALGEMAIDGVKKGYNAVKNWIMGVEEPSREQHHALQEETDKGILEWISDAGKKVKEMIGGFFSAMGTMIDRGIKDNFGCNEWSESRYSPVYGGQPRCLDPVISWPCATCSQKLNMSCGIVGFVGGEIVTAYLTGGAVGLIKAGVKAGAASKVATTIAKTKSFQYLSKGAKLAAKPLVATGKGMMGVLRLSAKSAVSVVKFGRKWALKIGGRFLPVSNATKIKILRMMVKGKNLAKKPFSAYMRVLERSFAAGYHGADGVTYLLQARKLAAGTSPTRAGAELLDFATDSAKYNTMKTQLAKSHDEYTKLLREYNRTLENISDLGPSQAAKISRDQIQRLNKIKADQKLLIKQLKAEKKTIQAAVVAANNTTDAGQVTLTSNRAAQNTGAPLVRQNTNTTVRSGNTPVRQGVSPTLADNVPIASTNLADDIASKYRVGDQIDLAYKSGNKKTVIFVRETDKQMIVRFKGDPADKIRRINKVDLNLDGIVRYDRAALVADDVDILVRPTTLAGNQGAVDDLVRLKYNKSSNGYDGFITGRIAKETDDTIWIVNASHPKPGTPIRKVNLDLTKTRNYFDTRHLNSTRNLQAADDIAFTEKGEKISGEIVRMNQKSITLKDKLGNIKRYDLKKIDLGSFSSKVIDPATGARIRVSTTSTGTVIADDIGRTTTPLTAAQKTKYEAISAQIKPYVGKAQDVILDVADKGRQVGKIMDRGSDFVVLRTSAGDAMIKYKDVLKVTIPGRMLLALDGERPVYTDLSSGPRVDQDGVVIPGPSDGYGLIVRGTLGDDKDTVTCVATVTKAGQEIDPDAEKNEESLKWIGHDRCLDKVECAGKMSESFNNIDVVLEIPDKPESEWKKAKCAVTPPSPDTDGDGVTDPDDIVDVPDPIPGNDTYTVVMEKVKEDPILKCSVVVKKGNDVVSMSNLEGKKLVWSNDNDKCSDNVTTCEGDMNLGFNNVTATLQIDGMDPGTYPSATCSDSPTVDTWELNNTKSDADESKLVCQFELKKNGLGATLEDGMTLTFNSDKCNEGTLLCSADNTEVGDDGFVATLKKGEEILKTSSCSKTVAPPPDISWSLDVEHKYESDDKEHVCTAEVQMDDEEMSASSLSEKGYTLIWTDKSDCKGKFKCKVKKPEGDDKAFESLDLKLVKSDDAEEKAIMEATCTNEEGEDIYANDEEDENQNGPGMRGPFHNYGPGTPIVPPQPTMLPPPMTYFHANFN